MTTLPRNLSDGPKAGVACRSSTDCDTQVPPRYFCLDGDEYTCRFDGIRGSNPDDKPACADCLVALVSGLYFYGSGARFSPTSGGDRRNVGTATGSRLRADGSLVGRNSFVGNPIHRVDLRVSKSLALVGHLKIEGFADSFNLFNHENYNSYTLNETSALYGKGSDGSLARRLQLGFRVTF